MAGERTATPLDWSDITAAAGRIAQQVRADSTPDVLVGVLRGGVVPAVVLAHQLGVRCVRAVEVLHTCDDGVNAGKTTQPLVTNPASLGDLTGLDVLLVDDVVGSGDTIVCAAELVRAAGAARVRTAVLVVNIGNWRRAEDLAQALSYRGITVDGWVVFPWEKP